MARNEDVRRIALWVTKLALLTSAGNTPVSKEKIGLTAAILADEFPAEMFTEKTLSDVSSGMEFFPAYATLKSAMERFRPVRRVEGMRPVGGVLPDWMLQKVMAECGNDPGQMLRGWLAGKGISEAQISAFQKP
jgi:hypothetical protein